MNRLSTHLGDVFFDNPLFLASGTCGFGYELVQFFLLEKLGAITLTGTTLKPLSGNPTPRIAETSCGMLNAIGLQNPGVKSVVNEEMPKLRNFFKGPVIANISGFSIEEYVETAMYFDKNSDVSILEINVSCPNIKGGGIIYGSSIESVTKICKNIKASCKKPIYIKLSPNVTNIVDIAKACEGAGADGITLINTLRGMAINPRSGKPILANITGGLSGPAIFPVALAMIYEVYKQVSVPIIGVGGVSTADDIISMMSAGASAVQVGAQVLINPMSPIEILNNLVEKMDEYGIDRIEDIIGRAHS